MTNCKQGDLAIIVRSQLGQDGIIVRCPELMSSKEFIADGPNGKVRFTADVNHRVWRVDRVMRMQTRIESGGYWIVEDCYAADKCLRPIRDNDGEDETLTWAGKPVKVKEKAR